MSTSPITRPDDSPRRARRTPLYLQIAAWSVPVLVLGQFAMVAIVPVAIVLVGAFADRRVRTRRGLRAAASLLGVVYATPLAIWAIRPDGAQSLSKDMHPLFYALIAVASAVVLGALYASRKK